MGMTKNQLEREAIRTVLRQMGVPINYQDISLRAGERLASTLMEMVQDGEVVRTDAQGGSPAVYHLSARGGTSYEAVRIPPQDGEPVGIVITEEMLEQMNAPASPERLAAEESAREINRKLATGEAVMVDESGSYSAPPGLTLPSVVGEAVRDSGARVVAIRIDTAGRLVVTFERQGVRSDLYLFQSTRTNVPVWEIVAAEAEAPADMWESVQRSLRERQKAD